MSNNKEFHIVFSCPEYFPEYIVQEIVDDISITGLNLKIEKRPVEPYASIEWAIPGLIFAYLAKPYFESFLGEAGKDHYQVLKKWLKKIVVDSRQIKVNTITAAQSTKKTDNTNTQSKAISVYIESIDNRRIKLLFDVTLDEKSWENSIDSILDLARENYEKYPHDKLSTLLKDLEHGNNSTYYAVIDRQTNDWKFMDDRILFEQMTNRKENS